MKSFEIRDFGPIRHVRGVLSPLHAFIGPNDSGKTSILNAIGAARHVFGGREVAYDGMRRAQQLAGRECSVELSSSHARAVVASQGNGHWHRAVTGIQHAKEHYSDSGNGFQSIQTPTEAEHFFSGPTIMVRLTSAVLLRPVASVVEPERELSWMDGRSHNAGLAALAINALGRNREVFGGVEDRVRRLFPHVDRLQLEPEPTNGGRDWRLDYVLKDGTTVPSEFASEGLLRFTAFALLLATTLPGLVVVEEPENGLHPTRAQDVVTLLREVSESTQVLVATHSPVVVNALRPEEVTVVWRPDLERGTQVKPISETANFDIRSKAYSLGDLWVSYADGETEAPLREPPDEGAAAE